MTHTARTPATSADSTAGYTAAAGTQMTTRSTGSDSSSMLRTAATPATGSPERLTGNARPVYPPSTMLRNTAPPMAPGRADAPITATVCGRKNDSSDRSTAAWSRRSTASRKRSLGAIRSSTWISPDSKVRSTS